jgi:hypothetical protein
VAATKGTVRVEGYRETMRALKAMESSVAREAREALKEAAEPVAITARAKISIYDDANVGTIKPRAGIRGAFVTQGAKKVTGQRGDFGTLQQRRLGEALDEHGDDIADEVEDAFSFLARKHGF